MSIALHDLRPSDNRGRRLADECLAHARWKPFVGEHISAVDRYGQPGFTKVLERIAAREASMKKLRAGIQNCGSPSRIAERAAGSGSKIDNQLFQTAYETLSRSFDEKKRVGTAPKFPRPVSLNFLRDFTPARRQAHRLPGKATRLQRTMANMRWRWICHARKMAAANA